MLLCGAVPTGGLGLNECDLGDWGARANLSL